MNAAAPLILGLAPPALALALGAALVAGFVRGLAGFGLAIMLVPVLALAILPREAVVVANGLTTLIGLQRIPMLRRNSERSAVGIGLIALLALPLGMLALVWIDPAPARALIAGIAIGAFVAVLLPPRQGHQPGRIETVGTGVAAGLLTGFAAMPGPPVVPYYLRRALEPRVARASMMTVFLIVQGAGAALAVVSGEATLREGGIVLLLWPAAWLGDVLGTRAFGRVNPGAWRIIAGTVLGASAFAAVMKLLQAG